MNPRKAGEKPALRRRRRAGLDPPPTKPCCGEFLLRDPAVTGCQSNPCGLSQNWGQSRLFYKRRKG